MTHDVSQKVLMKISFYQIIRRKISILNFEKGSI